jgi:peptidoglycan/LPS O-acetylase OafA/YrhL
MGAYVVFPLVVALVDWNRLATRRLLLVGVLLLAALWGYFAMQGVGRLGERVSQMGLVRCLLEFWLGNVLRLWGRWRGVAGAATAAWLAAVAALLGGLALGWHETSFIPACFAALILALALDKGLPRACWAAGGSSIWARSAIPPIWCTICCSCCSSWPLWGCRRSAGGNWRPICCWCWRPRW